MSYKVAFIIIARIHNFGNISLRAIILYLFLGFFAISLDEISFNSILT